MEFQNYYCFLSLNFYKQILQNLMTSGSTLFVNLFIYDGLVKKWLTLCMLGNYSCLCCRLQTFFFKIKLFKKSNRLDQDQDLSEEFIPSVLPLFGFNGLTQC